LEEYKGKLVMADIEVRWYEPSSGEWITNTPENAGVYTDLFISPYGLIAGGNRGGLLGPLSVFTEMEYWDDSYFQIGNGLPYLFAQNTEYQFIADWNRIARSNIGGQHWEWMNSFTDTNTYILDMITIEDAIYVIQTEGPYQHNRLYVSYDYGTSWAKADLGIPIEDSDTGPQRLIEVGDFLLCCTQGYKSGVYFSRKDQILWQKWNDGLPYLNVKDVISDGEYIYAAVTSQGVWKRKIDEIKNTNTQDEESIHVSSMELYPNPTNGQFYIHLDADDLIGARLKMYDLQGKVILEKIISDLNSAIETGGLPNGLYGVELKTNTNCYATKLIVQY